MWTTPTISMTPPDTVTAGTIALQHTAVTTDVGPHNEVLHRRCHLRGTVCGTAFIIRRGTDVTILIGDVAQCSRFLQYSESKTQTEAQRHGGRRMRTLYPPFSKAPQEQ